MKSDKPRHAAGLSRRDFIAAGSLAGLGGLALRSGAHPAAPDNAITRENGRRGDRGWLLERPRVTPELRSPGIEGYCSQASIRAGETLEIFVSTNPASEFSLNVYRLGFYGGAGGRKVHTVGPLAGTVQSDPEVGPKRVRNCRWRPSVSFEIPRDWLSGVYLGKLSAEPDGAQSYVIFIVRDERCAALLFQCSDFTWHAYNRWPDRFSLYDDGKNEWYWGGGVQVSLNRPYGRYRQDFVNSVATVGSGEFLLWEFPFAYWLEEHGYDVSYVSNLDTHRDPAGLHRAAGFLSVGHDEYWTIEMFRHVEAAVRRGLSVGFFSGNAVCGRIALGADGDRAFERVGVFGPPGGTHEFVAMESLVHERPYANELIGAHSTGPVTGGADWICRMPEHWAFGGTGMKVGEDIPGLVGWEWHGDPASIPGLQILASGPTQSAPGKPNGGQYTATIYPSAAGNFVFNASTIWWADGLSAPPGYQRPSVYTTPNGPDPRVQQITRNILDQIIARARATPRAK